MTILGLNKITITASTSVPYKEDKKRVRYTLRSKFSAKDPETGDRRVYRYLGSSGQEEPVTIDGALVLDMENPIDAHNYKTLLINLQADQELQSIISIIDTERDAESFADKKIKVSSATYALTSAYETKNFDKLRNIYRRKYGSAQGVTDAMILQTLIKMAEDSPDELFSLEKDASSENKILVDKAVEKGILLNSDGSFLSKDGSFIAANEGKILQLLDENSSFKDTLIRQVEAAFISLNAEKKIFRPELLLGDDIVTDGNLYPDKTDEKTHLSDEDIYHITKIGVKSGTIDMRNGKYFVGDSEFTRKELEEYYKNNPLEAMRLKEEMIGLSVYIERQ